jgi:hypothetical protein
MLSKLAVTADLSALSCRPLDYLMLVITGIIANSRFFGQYGKSEETEGDKYADDRRSRIACTGNNMRRPGVS